MARNGPYSSTHRGRGQRSREAVLEGIHTDLFEIVGVAVTHVAATEKEWSQQEMVKRIVRYIYKAAQSQELLTLRWEELVRTLVEQAMGSYASACQDKQWFYEIDLAQAFASVSWELLCLSSRPRVRFSQVKALVEQEYVGCVESTLLTKAMWDATSMVFLDCKVRSKIYNSLHKAYQTALEESLADSRPMEELKRVEIFMKRWIDDSMGRAWCSLEAVEMILTDTCVVRLFGALTAPYGDQHPYSCIPYCLTKGIGRPPRDWAFIGQTVEQLFDSWRAKATSRGDSGSSRKGKTECSAALVSVSKAPMEPMTCFAHNAPVNKPFSPVKAEILPKREPSPAGSSNPKESFFDLKPEFERVQHPFCANAGDCIGHHQHRLIRHVVDHEKLGDVYCEQCWQYFLTLNHSLQGILEDGPLQGQRINSLTQAVKQLPDSWNTEATLWAASGSAQKRGKESSAALVSVSKAPVEPMTGSAHDAPVNRSSMVRAQILPKREPSPAGSSNPKESSFDELEPKLEGTQHPFCTNAEECIGQQQQRLIRHIADSERLGDVYCEQCWQYFVTQNERLQGIWEDGPWQGQRIKSLTQTKQTS